MESTPGTMQTHCQEKPNRQTLRGSQKDRTVFLGAKLCGERKWGTGTGELQN